MILCYKWLLKNNLYAKITQLEAKDADLEEHIKAHQLQMEEHIKAHQLQMEEHIKVHQLQTDVQQLKNEAQDFLALQLLRNIKLRYNTRRRILVAKARKQLLTKLGLEKEERVKWEDFVKNLSSSEKATLGATEDMLQVMGTGLYILNKAVHSMDSEVEMVHVVNNIRDHFQKTTWQALFTYVYNKDLEDVGFV
jgi:hypothetical protein